VSEDSENEKTHDPTQKKLDDAHQRGNVAKSQEVNTWFLLAGGTLVLSSFHGSIGTGLLTPMKNLLQNSWMMRTDGPGLIELTKELCFSLLSTLGLPFLFLIMAVLAGNLMQHRLVFSTEGLTPKFSKLSPMEGAKRLFGKQALANFLKGLFKLVVVGTVMCLVLWPERFRLDSMVRIDPSAILGISMSLTLKLLGAVLALLAFVAVADFFFQYRSWFEKLKMSLQEVKEEFKQSEGDPHIKGKIKQLRQQNMKKRMMSAVPQASVIITNPTHYSVALKYERGMQAPICVAKGMDAIALKIREVAGKHDIPIVENVPLARALYATVEIDQEIPSDHYQAVAEVIGYVMGLKRGLSGRPA
jgi:flagellar biosynthetic protein FlhB